MSEPAGGLDAWIARRARRWKKRRQTRRQAKRSLKEAEREQRRARRREKAERRRLLRSARIATGSRQVSLLHRNDSGWWIQDRIGRWWQLGEDETWRLWEPGAHWPSGQGSRAAWRVRAATSSHSYLLLELQDRQNELLEEQNRLLRRAAGEREPGTAQKQIGIDREEADLLLSLCEPGSTLEQPSITEGNYRRFVVAQAEAERQRRLKASRTDR